MEKPNGTGLGLAIVEQNRTRPTLALVHRADVGKRNDRPPAAAPLATTRNPKCKKSALT